MSKALANASDTEFLPPICEVRGVLLLVLLAGGVSVLTTLLSSDLRAFDWYQFAMVSLYCCWIVLSAAALLCALRDRLNRLSLAAAATYSYVLILLVVLAVSIAAQWFTDRQERFVFDGWLLLKQILAAMIMAGIGLRYAYLNQLLKQREKSELAARVQALQARIKPHFLFNSLNTIASLIAISPEKAEQAVEDLSGLFRESLRDSDGLGTLADELAICEQYLRIEQLRLDERLQLDWQIDDALLSQPMPRLLLQPLVENAVLHGIQSLPKGGELGVTISAENDSWFCQIRNPIGGPPTAGNGQALANIRHRLHAIYETRARLDIEEQGDTFVASLRLPLEASL